MTPQYATYGEEKPFDSSVFAESFYGVLRTGGLKAARGWGEGRDEGLIKPYGEDEESGEHRG